MSTNKSIEALDGGIQTNTTILEVHFRGVMPMSHPMHRSIKEKPNPINCLETFPLIEENSTWLENMIITKPRIKHARDLELSSINSNYLTTF